MKDYKVRLVSTGSLTQLPDSQKVFGALVYMFSEKHGREKASMLTKALLDKQIHFALSNVMPLDYLPTPQEYIIDCISGANGTDALLKEKLVATKKRNYISPTELKHVLEEPERCVTVFPYIKLEKHQQLRASIESNYYDIPALDTKLYSVPTIDLLKISKEHEGEEQKEPVNTFYFYLQADDSDILADFLDMLEEAVSTKRTVILGKRASQGLNTFQFLEINVEDFQHNSISLFLNMGMLLPDKIDFASSTLKLFTSERRPFEMVGGWDENFTRHYISFIAEGSIVSVPGGLTGAGKSIKSPFNQKRDIVFGNSFLYPISLPEGQV